jgi:hypothetical protein
VNSGVTNIKRLIIKIPSKMTRRAMLVEDYRQVLTIVDIVHCMLVIVASHREYEKILLHYR